MYHWEKEVPKDVAAPPMAKGIPTGGIKNDNAAPAIVALFPTVLEILQLSMCQFKSSLIFSNSAIVIFRLSINSIASFKVNSFNCLYVNCFIIYSLYYILFWYFC
ncbi:MAG: hypothetical protein MRERV_10c058 [Mycoplasmataceae bacterium RV_VA103A]|nr:MAG: hypothetical protein MRERV_10c058 [Mycoplasmataceae bacterium RV_VA103A]